MKSSFRAKSGFTLMEAVVALAILVVAAVSLLALCPIGMRQVDAGLLETRGAHVAQRFFTTLRSCSFYEADCFGTVVNLAQVADSVEPLRFYASDEACFNISPRELPESRFLLTVAFRALPDAPAGVDARIVTLSLSPLHRAEERATYQAVIVHDSGT